ncbi:hypothetical protein Pelo_6226 [Pelomyxa schiedti]|nr:hypothetical protein Pelo_6226 [Pelomyxa schiedti]
MFGVGEGVFPLVGLVSSSLLRHYASHHVVIVAAAEAGATSCVNWLIANRRAAPKHRHRGGSANSSNNKVVLWVLGGLCGGGHLEMAKKLAAGRWPGGGLTWRSCCIGGGGNGIVGGGCHGGEVECGGIGDHVRDSGILKRACKNGHMDVAKWMVERFNIRDPWECVDPLRSAVSHGHLELAQWLFNTFHLSESVSRYSSWPHILIKACKSESLEVVKWCFENFPMDDRIYGLFIACCIGKKSSCLEICKYVTEHVREHVTVRENPIRRVSRVDVLRWSTTAFSVLSIPDNYSLVMFCEGKGGLELVKFTVEEFSINPTPNVFIAACRTKAKDGVALVRWLSTKVTLSPEDLCNSLATALSRDNTIIATWLDETFNIMQQLSTWNMTPGSFLYKVCKKMLCFQERVKGVQWILNHPEMSCIEESLVVKAVNKLVNGRRSTSTAPCLLIEKFTISEPTRTQLLFGILKESVEHDGITQAKKIISMGGFTKDSVARCLATAGGFRSSKAVKWLIKHFQLDHCHITAAILFNLMVQGKESCVEWLINKFHITLDEVLSIPFNPSPYNKFDLFLWEMILRQFPGAITATKVKEKLLPVIIKSPVIAQSAIRRIPDLTVDHIMTFAVGVGALRVPLATRCWLRDMNPEIWPNEKSKL